MISKKLDKYNNASFKEDLVLNGKGVYFNILDSRVIKDKSETTLVEVINGLFVTIEQLTNRVKELENHITDINNDLVDNVDRRLKDLEENGRI